VLRWPRGGHGRIAVSLKGQRAGGRFSILNRAPCSPNWATPSSRCRGAASLAQKTYSRGSNHILRGPIHGDYRLVILKGRVKVSLLGKDHHETIVRILERPDS